MNGRNFKLSISNMRFYIFTRMVWKFKLSGLIFVMDSIYRSPYAIGSHRSLFFFLPSGLRVKQRYRVHVQACCFAFALPSHQLPEFIFFFLQSHLALLRTPFSDPLFRTPRMARFCSIPSHPHVTSGLKAWSHQKMTQFFFCLDTICLVEVPTSVQEFKGHQKKSMMKGKPSGTSLNNDAILHGLQLSC